MSAADRAPEGHLHLALLIAVAGVCAMVLWGLFGFHDGSALRAPTVLRGQVENALRAAGFTGLEVQMHGQRALVFGVVANRDQIAAAREAALAAAGAGGPWAGGVTSVDMFGVHVGAVEHPFAWRAWRDGSSLVLTGAAPSESTRRALLADAAALFPNAVTLDQMHVAGGAPSPRWREVARDALAELATLNSGEARINETEVVLMGGGSQAAVDAMKRHYHAPLAPFQVRIEASVQ